MTEKLTLAQEYKRQFQWRDWDTALSLCPITANQPVLDLGCGPGDISRKLAERGAIVTGVDTNSDLLAVARTNSGGNCSFEEQDLRSLSLKTGAYDGIWSSFTAAYFINFDQILKGWMRLLKTNAWICIVEIDDLLGHTPRTEKNAALVEEFYSDAVVGGRYDFKMGRKIEPLLKSQGFQTRSIQLKDQELSFDGPANEEVLTAWCDRISRMGGLRNFLGARFPQFETDYFNSLASAQHRSLCSVICTVGIRGSR